MLVVVQYASLEDGTHRFPVVVERPEHRRHVNPVGRRIQHVHRITSSYDARRDYLQVRPRKPMRHIPFQPTTLSHVHPERAARDPRTRHFQHRLTDLPARADDRVIHVEPDRREVLAEHAVIELPAQLPAPPVHFLARHGIHRLIVAAVVFAVPDEVPEDAAAEAAVLRAGRPHADLRHRTLADPGRHRLGRIRF